MVGLGPQPHLTGRPQGPLGLSPPMSGMVWTFAGLWKGSGGIHSHRPLGCSGSLRGAGSWAWLSLDLLVCTGDARGHLAGCWEDLVGKCGPGTVPASHLAP